MAFTTSGMKTLIAQGFESMKGTGDDMLFASSITNGCVTAVGTAMVNASPQAGADAGPTGSFTGTAAGTMQVVPASCQATIFAACNAMKGGAQDDDYLASQIATAIDTMCKAATFTITITGTTVQPTPLPPVSSVDTGVGTFSSQAILIESELKSVMAKMKQVSDGQAGATDDDLVTALCTGFENYMKAAQVSIVGATHLAGTSGMGTIS